MRKIDYLLFFCGVCTSFSSANAQEEERVSWGRGSIGMEELAENVSGNTYLRAKPFLAFDATLPFGLTTGLGLAYYETPYGQDYIRQTSLSLRIGWQFLKRRLQLLARADLIFSHFSASSYDGDIHEGYGVEALFHFPIAFRDHLQLELGGGWSYVPRTNFNRCFLGVGNGGDEICTAPGPVAPQYNYFSLHAGVAWGL